MCYYTLTLDHTDSDSHKRAIMIVDAKSKNEATSKFLNTFGPHYYNEITLTEGIHIPSGFDRLLTEHVKKYILKVKSGLEDAPPTLEYHNMIKLGYVS